LPSIESRDLAMALLAGFSFNVVDAKVRQRKLVDDGK
jgi:hypothetical protein